MKPILTFLALAGLVALGSCASPSDASTTSSPATVSTKAYALTQQTAGNWPTVKVAIQPLSGKTISGATFTYAADANTLANGLWTQFEFDAAKNYSDSLGKPATAKTWTTTANVASAGYTGAGISYAAASSYVAFDFGYSSTVECTVWIKQVNLTYSDGTTEVLTFTTGTTALHSVATPSAGAATTTDGAVSDRFWFSDWTSGSGAADLSAGLTKGVVTVAF